ncbi:hypothetical protein DPSP01_013149 [Paraphaeosphaeria sporulosa]
MLKSSTFVTQSKRDFINIGSVDFTISPLTGPTVSAGYYSSYMSRYSEAAWAAVMDKDTEWGSSIIDARLDMLDFLATQTAVSIRTVIMGELVKTAYTEMPEWYTKLRENIHQILEEDPEIFKQALMDKPTAAPSGGGAYANAVKIGNRPVAADLAGIALLSNRNV